MEFKLFQKLGSLEGIELVLLIAAAAVFVLLLVLAIRAQRRNPRTLEARPRNSTRTLVYGALCLTLSFVLSYFKLFSMPFGGSITLCSMLPLVAYACYFGPAAGFSAAFAYAVLQVIQGAWIVHWAQFILDYFVAFTVLGVAAFFPRKLPLGMAVAGFLRMAASTVSGAVFFGENAAAYGIASPWVYSLLYSGLTIGVDTVLCVIVAVIPAFAKLFDRSLGGKSAATQA